MLPCRRVEAESRGAARGRGKAGSVCRRDGEGLTCGSSALITAAALVCHGQLAAQGRHKSACEHSSSPPNPSESLGAGKAAWPARNGPGTQGSAGDTGLCSPHACSVAGPCFWKVPVAVGPTEGRMWASALACSRVQQHPGRASPLYHLMCAAAETPPPYLCGQHRHGAGGIGVCARGGHGGGLVRVTVCHQESCDASANHRQMGAELGTVCRTHSVGAGPAPVAPCWPRVCLEGGVCPGGR